MSEPLTLAYFAAKGGQGTTVVAASVALVHAAAGQRTLLIDAADHQDTYAALGLAEPTDHGTPTAVNGSLDLCTSELRDDLDHVDTTGYDVVVIDAGQHRPAFAAATLVTRSCYLALRRALTISPPPDNAIVIAEPGRALDTHDVGSVLGVPVIATIRTDPAIARTVDAGLLATRLPASLRQLRPELVQLPPT